ncbi:MAG: helix-turn-helix domain-containing protein, partial [Clostridia bacterium]|nr:helix-turn-helix domain-containing protein [Clostridia bacterium]
LFEQNIYFSNFVLSNATERFSDVMWTMQQILFMNIDKRLAIFLIDESNKSDSLKLNITHEQIAKYIGSSREVISRMLNYFQKQKYIKLFRGGLLITNKDKLKELIKN